MNRASIVALLFVAASAQAQQPTANYCSLLGSVYQTAASARDTRRSPDDALKLTRPYAAAVPELLRIEIINQMYFDPRFAMARGEALRVTVRNECMNPSPQYQPLQARK